MKKKTSKEKEYFSLPIGIIPNWLLKAETGKGFWENLIPDKEFRESVLAKIKEREGQNAGVMC